MIKAAVGFALVTRLGPGLSSGVKEATSSAVSELSPGLTSARTGWMPLNYSSSSDFVWTKSTLNVEPLNWKPIQSVFSFSCSVGRWAKQLPDMKGPAAVSDSLGWIYARGRTNTCSTSVPLGSLWRCRA